MKKILVIDDNTDIRENTAEILELAGYKAFTAENGKRGVEVALREKPDVIVCDIMMPELDGYGVLHLVKKNADTQNIPFIFLTAKTERADFRKGMEMGADDYITKPFEEIELLTAIESRLKKLEILSQQYSSDPAGLNAFTKDISEAGLIKHVAEKYDTVSFNKKQVLYQEGKHPRFMYYIVKGKVKATRNHEDGKEYINDLYNAGDFLGYTAIIEDRTYDDTAIVMEDAEIIQIRKEDFLQMLNADVSIASKFIKLITRNVKEKEERLLRLAYSSLRKRVAGGLCEIYAKLNPGSEKKPIELSREEIAQYVGTATESLIRTLSDFKSEKLLEIKEGKIVIPDPSKLKELRY
jgi:CRP-like cAMP-binding protein